MPGKHNLKDSSLYNADTEPYLGGTTVPIPIEHLPRESWFQRFFQSVALCIRAIVRKINQLLAFALMLLLLLLSTRFLLIFFVLTKSLFVYWVLALSAPFVGPFENMAPPLAYQGFRIDISTLIAIFTYILGVIIIRKFLKVLVSRPA